MKLKSNPVVYGAIRLTIGRTVIPDVCDSVDVEPVSSWLPEPKRLRLVWCDSHQLWNAADSHIASYIRVQATMLTAIFATAGVTIVLG
jgi:hypothetical protein